MEYGISIWDTVYRYGHLPYRYGHLGYRNGIWANDMGDDSIVMVILDIDMGYVVTLLITLIRTKIGRARKHYRQGECSYRHLEAE
jgi:hypothetical protein